MIMCVHAEGNFLKNKTKKPWLGKNSVNAPRFVHPETVGISLAGWEGFAGKLVVGTIDWIHWEG